MLTFITARSHVFSLNIVSSLKAILTQFIHINILYFQRAIQTPVLWFSWAKLQVMTKDSKTNAVKCILTLLLDFTVITCYLLFKVIMSTPENGSMPFFMPVYTSLWGAIKTKNQHLYNNFYKISNSER